MSNYHVLEINELENHAQVAFHVSVPDELNGAGINLRTALKQYLERGAQSGTIESGVPWIAPAELTELQAGDLYEYLADTEFANAHAADLEKRDQIDAKYTTLVPAVQDRIRKILKFWGMDRDVP